MPRQIILSRKQLISCCRINSIAVGTEIMTYPQLLNLPSDLPADRPQLRVYWQALYFAKAQLPNFWDWDQYSEAPDLTNPSLETLLDFNQKVLASPSMVGYVAQILDKELDQLGDDPFGLVMHYNGMIQEQQKNPLFARTEASISTAEQAFQTIQIQHRDKKLLDGIELRDANTYFFNDAAQRETTMPHVLAVRAASSVAMGTNDQPAYEADAQKYFIAYLKSKENGIIQVTTNRHAVIFGKTGNVYWKFDSLAKAPNATELSDKEDKYAVLTLYDNAPQALQGLYAMRTPNNSIEIAHIEYQLKPQAIQEQQQKIQHEYIKRLREIQMTIEASRKIKPLHDCVSQLLIQLEFLEALKNECSVFSDQPLHQMLEKAGHDLKELIEKTTAYRDKADEALLVARELCSEFKLAFENKDFTPTQTFALIGRWSDKINLFSVSFMNYDMLTEAKQELSTFLHHEIITPLKESCAAIPTLPEPEKESKHTYQFFSSKSKAPTEETLAQSALRESLQDQKIACLKKLDDVSNQMIRSIHFVSTANNQMKNNGVF